MEQERWISRRNVVFGNRGVVASSQSLASQVGIKILNEGGNAADAAVAVAAALNVTEPCSTGIGGDAFCLYFDNKTKKVTGLNASGHSAAKLNLENGTKKTSGGAREWIGGEQGPNCVTVPGAAAGWCDTVSLFGSKKLTMQQILQPAIDLAENGFPVGEIAGHSWVKSEKFLKRHPNGTEMLLNGERAPKTGEIMKNVNLAKTFRELAEKGKDNFYTGRIGQAIVELIQSLGGFLTLEDLAKHKSEVIDTPISVVYHGVRVYEIPPNGQGITALIGLNILKNIFLESTKNASREPAIKYHSIERWHYQIEAMRLAFADSRAYVCDTDFVKCPTEGLLSDSYGQKRSKLIDKSKASADVQKGSPEHSSSTVYFSVVDEQGNACSFINSNYEGFGSGFVPKGCGFTLQNRGANFSLEENHPNVLEGGKRPYHTIIPGLAVVEATGELFASFGVMGGFMQPAGHVQVLMNMIDYGMNPQEALDQKRFCILDGESNGAVAVEDLDDPTVEALQKLGHKIMNLQGWQRGQFGRGQIIWRNPQTGVFWAGSDARGDGQAVAQV